MLQKGWKTQTKQKKIGKSHQEQMKMNDNLITFKDRTIDIFECFKKDEKHKRIPSSWQNI